MLNPYFDSLTNSGANEDTQVELRIQRAERPQLARKDTLDPRRVLGLTNALSSRADAVTCPLDPSAIIATAHKQTAALASLKVVVEDNIVTVGADLTDLFEQVEVLESGELVSGTAFSTNELGGAHLVITPAVSVTDPTTQMQSVFPTHAVLETFDNIGTIKSSVVLDGIAVKVSPALVVEGQLAAGGIEEVEGELNELKNKVLVLEISDAVNVAVDAAQALLIAAQALKIFPPPPPGYTGLPPDEMTPEYDPDNESVKVPPLRLQPAGEFPGTDLHGPISRALGKVGLNLNFPTREFDMVGEARVTGKLEVTDAARLCSNVAVMNGLELTNPDSAVVYLGTNTLVTTAGVIHAAGLEVEGPSDLTGPVAL